LTKNLKLSELVTVITLLSITFVIN